MTKPIVFISYSHKDEKEKVQLVSHLNVLENAGLIELWIDDRIEGGSDWQAEIKQAMAQASVAILLISVNFLTSEFTLDKEVPEFLNRRENEGLKVFPIIAKACHWEAFDWLTKMQVRPKNGVPVWSGNSDQIERRLADITKEIRTIVKEKSKKVTIPDTGIESSHTLKDKLLAIARNPIWQMIGVLIAVITFGWGGFTFYNSNSPLSTVTPTNTATRIAFISSLTPVPTKTQPPVPKFTLAPTNTSVPATFTPSPTVTPRPPSPTPTPTPAPTSKPTSTKTPSPPPPVPTFTRTLVTSPAPPTFTPTVEPVSTLIPLEGMSRIVFINEDSREYLWTINSQEYKQIIPGTKFHIDLPPGRYTWTISSAGWPTFAGESTVGADETWLIRRNSDGSTTYNSKLYP